MSYLERLLIPDETVLYRARRSVYPTFGGPALGFALAVAAAALLSLLPGAIALVWLLPLVPALWIGWRYLFWVNKIYLVTNHRVLKLEGVLAKSHSDAALDKINDMTLEQGLLGRLFGYGDLAIATANEEASVTYHSLDGPVEFKRQALMSREARQAEGPGGETASDPVAQLERLAALREKGAVTEEEFQKAKARLLSRMR